MRKRKRKRQLWHRTPWDGLPGIRAAILRLLYQIEGPSQLGKRDEPAYVADPNPMCPICSQAMSAHEINRGGPGKPTRLKCPKRGSDAAS